MSVRVSWWQPGSTARRALVAAVISASLLASRSPAQGWPSRPEVRPLIGVYIPTGRQHSLLEEGLALGAQLALELDRGVHAVSGFAWIPTEQRAPATGGRVEMAQFDLGAEWLSPGRRRIQRRFNPLLGAGIGIRAYRSRDDDTPSQADIAGYGALGVEAGAGRFAARLEGRNYLSAFRGLDGQEDTSLRNDATVAFGIVYHTR